MVLNEEIHKLNKYVNDMQMNLNDECQNEMHQ